MKIKIITLLILSIASYTLTAQQKKYELEAVDFINMILQNNKHKLIDIRTEKQFKKNRIKGAINAPNTQKLDQILKTLDTHRPILIYCQYGIKSLAVGKNILEKKENKIYSLKGGIKKWRKNGYEIDKKNLKIKKK